MNQADRPTDPAAPRTDHLSDPLSDPLPDPLTDPLSDDIPEPVDLFAEEPTVEVPASAPAVPPVEPAPWGEAPPLQRPLRPTGPAGRTASRPAARPLRRRPRCPPAVRPPAAPASAPPPTCRRAVPPPPSVPPPSMPPPAPQRSAAGSAAGPAAGCAAGSAAGPASAEPRRFMTATDFLDRRDEEQPIGPATWGWRGRVRRWSGGAIKPKMGAKEEAYQRDRRMIQKDFDGPRTIVFVNPKGGAAKTTGVLAAGYTFGTVRGGGVVAWDNNETRGTLGIRGTRGAHRNTTRELLEDLERFKDVGQSRIGDLGSFVRSQGDAHFDVLASDERPDVTGTIAADDFNEVHDLLERFYRVILVDSGNNMRAENWLAAVDAADLLVVTSTVREDTGYSGLWMLDALQDAGMHDLRYKTVTVLSDPSAKVDEKLADDLASVYQQRTRSVFRVPYDAALVAGSVMPYNQLSAETLGCRGSAPAPAWPRPSDDADPSRDVAVTGQRSDGRVSGMRAVVYSEPGPSSVLRVEERPDPTPGPGEVLVRVERAGVNPTDWKFRSQTMRGFDEVVPGQDGAGTVEAVGDGVESVRPGDRVWLVLAQHERPFGTAAELTVQPAARVVPLPENADADLGASLGVPAVTAHRALTAGDGVSRLGPGCVRRRHGAGGRGSGRGRQRRGPAGAVGRRVGGHHGQQRREGGARPGGRCPPRRELPHRRRRGRGARGGPGRRRPGGGGVARRERGRRPRGAAQPRHDLVLRRQRRRRGRAAGAAEPSPRTSDCQGVLLYPLAPDLVAVAAQDVNAAVAAGGCGWGRTPASRCTTSRSRRPRPPTTPSSSGAVGKVLLDL